MTLKMIVEGRRIKIMAKLMFTGKRCVQFLFYWYYCNGFIDIKQRMSQRVFYQLLQEVGTLGRYQNNLLIFWCIFLLTCGSTTYYNAFLFYTGEYICPSDNPNCRDYVCSLSKQERNKFIDPHFSSIARKFDYDGCDSNFELEGIQAFVYMGGLIGVFAGSIVNQYISKKRMLILTTLMGILSLVLVITTNSIYLVAFGLFVNFSIKGIDSDLIPCYITETVGQENRGKHMMALYLSFGLGATLNGLVFMLLPSWEIALIVYQLLPYCVFLAGLIFYIEETPFDSVVNYSVEESFQALIRIAQRNGRKDNHGLTIHMIDNVKRQYQKNELQNKKDIISILDLFRYDSLRTISIICILLHFFISFEFNVPVLSVQYYAVNIYWSAVIVSSSEIISSAICIFMVDHFQRRQVMLVVSALGVLVSLIVVIFASCSQSVSYCGIFQSVVQIAGLSLYRFLASIAYCFFCIAQCEVFPTQIRSIGSQITTVVSSTAIIITPFIQNCLESRGISMINTFVLASLLLFLTALKMPETFNVPPPEMIKELEYVHRHGQLNEAD